jgi:hypothetical protein
MQRNVEGEGYQLNSYLAISNLQSSQIGIHFSIFDPWTWSLASVKSKDNSQVISFHYFESSIMF